MGFAKFEQGRSPFVALIAACAIALSCGASTGPAWAQSSAPSYATMVPVVYPARGQSPKQQDQDKYECHDWARGQSGFDPSQPAQPAPIATTSQPSQSTSSAAGMVKGAAGGAAVAELSDRSAGKGAAVGVLGAAMRERAKQQQAAQSTQQQAAQQQQQAAQQQAAGRQQRATYDRAFGACMEARGYSVK